jgi:EAL domain-containing protein (putative c-di-GMP-specific phosphodiesterase class I)/GGDEF domain-containing protein
MNHLINIRQPHLCRIFRRIASMLLPIAVLITLSLSVSSQEMVDDVSVTDERIVLGELAEYLEDSNNSISIEQIKKPANGLIWQKITNETPNFGYTDSAYWVHLQLTNRSDHIVDRVMEISYPVIDYIDFYQLSSGKIEKQYNVGDKRPFSNRPIAHRNFVFPISLEAQSKSSIYIKVKSSSSLQLPISIASERKFFASDQLDLIRMCVYYGMMLVMILFNLFIFFSLREVMYFYYVSFVFCFAAVQFCLQGMAGQYIWPEKSYLQDFGILIFVPSIVLFASLFARYFLDLANNAPWANRFFKIIGAISIACIAGSLVLDYEQAIKLSVIVVIPASLGCLLIGPYLWAKGHTIARFYTIAWASITIATVALALSKFGIIPRTFLTENGLQFGSAMEAVLLSLALADRLNNEREQRFQAQEEMLNESRQRQLAEQKLIYSALHHPLTGAPNRAFFENWFKEQIEGLGDIPNMTMGMFYLCRFHEVNKTLGHIRADELLKLITKELNSQVKQIPGAMSLDEKDSHSHYIVAMEGVTFVILINNSKNQNPKESINSIALKLSEPLEFNGMAIDLGCVCGTAAYVQQQSDAQTLLRNAQIAIDMGERHGKMVTEYSNEINPYNSRRLSLAGELRKAIDHNELTLHFQAKFCSKNGKITGMEALLRWTHSEHGFIPPDEFIPIAEQTGVINPLTKWVIDRALSQLSELREMGFELFVAVNISAVNLKERHFPRVVHEALQKYQIPADMLTLEVTETAMMDDPARALSALQELNSLGVRLSIDDFGTGYSSLAYIKQLPVQEIKIDRSFVMEMDSHGNDAIIVKTTINMCHDLGYDVVAEGVETAQTCEALSLMGCDYLQGYHLSRPLAFEDFVAFVKKENDLGNKETKSV